MQENHARLRNGVRHLRAVIADLAQPSWARDFPRQDKIDATMDLPPDHPTIARDGGYSAPQAPAVRLARDFFRHCLETQGVCAKLNCLKSLRRQVSFASEMRMA